MRVFKFILLGVLVLMSLAAGIAKVMRAPQEVAFFDAVGISPNLLIPFGLLQIIGAVLTVIPKTRKLGLTLMAVFFFFSGFMIIKNGDIFFAFVSLIPVVGALYLAFSRWDAEILPSK